MRIFIIFMIRVVDVCYQAINKGKKVILSSLENYPAQILHKEYQAYEILFIAFIYQNYESTY